MSKYIRIELAVALTEKQEEVLGDISEFSIEEWNQLIREAIQDSYITESTESIIILDTEIVDNLVRIP